MKSLWNGSISFGLVNIPIKLYSAVDSKGQGFKMLHKKDNKPIHYKRVCEDGHEVDWEDIVKGYEVEKDEFYIITKEEMASLKPEKTDTIEVVEFVDSNQIDPIYFDKHYFAGPTKKNEKPYFLFREVLQDRAKTAIGRFVMREKEHICAIEAYKEGILITLMNYSFEIRDISGIEDLKDPPKLKNDEIKLAKQLIDKIYEQQFNIDEFKDTFNEELQKMLKKKKKGEPIKIKPVSKSKKELDLVEALKASLK